jgi:hypothetical protein
MTSDGIGDDCGGGGTGAAPTQSMTIAVVGGTLDEGAVVAIDEVDAAVEVDVCAAVDVD